MKFAIGGKKTTTIKVIGCYTEQEGLTFVEASDVLFLPLAMLWFPMAKSCVQEKGESFLKFVDILLYNKETKEVSIHFQNRINI